MASCWTFGAGLADAPVNLANLYTTNYGTSQTVVLNAGSSLGGNNEAFIGTLNLAGTVPLTIQATNTAGHATAQDWMGRIVGSGIPSGSTALILDGTQQPLRLTFTGSSANNFTGDVLIEGHVSTQGVTYNGQTAANQNLGFLNNNVIVAPGATWTVVWGGETVAGLSGCRGNVVLNNQNDLNNIGLTVGNGDGSGTFSGAISGGFGLDKVGSGTLVLGSQTSILNAGSSFTGNVTIDGGQLVAASQNYGNATVHRRLFQARGQLPSMPAPCSSSMWPTSSVSSMPQLPHC